MKLSDRLPNKITVGKRRYKCDFDFRNVLRMMDIMASDDILQSARDYLAAKQITKRPPKNARPFIDAVKELLFPGSTPNPDAKKLTDFNQDANLIRAAFRQAYGIDLYRDRVHWMEFSGLLNALPEGSRYSEVLGIRARPIPAPNKYNQHERDWLIKAKEQVAIKLSDKEILDSYNKGVISVFRGMMGMIQRGEDNG